jgi:hypothetical protein
MSFQQRDVGKRGIYGRWFKETRPYIKASTGIDPMPLPTSLRRDDIHVEACNQCGDDMLSEAFNIPL